MARGRIRLDHPAHRTPALPTADRTWSLFSRDRNLRFHAYDLIKPSRNVDDILAEIGRDPISIFWG
jgi:hypothetical protein